MPTDKARTHLINTIECSYCCNLILLVTDIDAYTISPWSIRISYHLISSVWDDCLSVYRDSQLHNKWPFHTIASLYHCCSEHKKQGHADPREIPATKRLPGKIIQFSRIAYFKRWKKICYITYLFAIMKYAH